jgi:ABC-type dipeptide/oligopeptide/nickel transport system ATPase component
LELLKLVIKFDFEEFFDLNKKVDKSAEEIAGKDIILLLGSTGSGKSTTVHYLCGSKMELMRAPNGIMHISASTIKNRELRKVAISAVSKSETRYITPIPVSFKHDLG